MVLSFATGKAPTGNYFRKVYNALYKARTKWRPIGIKLDIEVSDLDDIEEYKGNDRRLEEMVRKWLKNCPCWEALIAALKSPQVDEGGIVYEIELVSPENCYMTGKGLEVARLGEEATAALHALDLGGREREKPIHNISYELCAVSCQDAPTVKCWVTKRDRNYEIRYNPTTRGQHQLHVKVDGKLVKGSPFSVVVKIPIEKLGTPFRTIDGLNVPCNVAVNKRGEIIVLSMKDIVYLFLVCGERRSVRLDPKAQLLAMQLDQPCGVSVDEDGNILVADYAKHRIQKFSPDGNCKFIKSVGTMSNGPLFNMDLLALPLVRKAGSMYVTYRSPHLSTVIPYGALNCPSSVPLAQKVLTNYPWLVNTDTRS